jgi:hypothetical protein
MIRRFAAGADMRRRVHQGFAACHGLRKQQVSQRVREPPWLLPTTARPSMGIGGEDLI